MITKPPCPKPILAIDSLRDSISEGVSGLTTLNLREAAEQALRWGHRSGEPNSSSRAHNMVVVKVEGGILYTIDAAGGIRGELNSLWAYYGTDLRGSISKDEVIELGSPLRYLAKRRIAFETAPIVHITSITGSEFFLRTPEGRYPLVEWNLGEVITTLSPGREVTDIINQAKAQNGKAPDLF